VVVLGVLSLICVTLCREMATVILTLRLLVFTTLLTATTTGATVVSKPVLMGPIILAALMVMTASTRNSIQR
jgi:hypothetical protein